MAFANFVIRCNKYLSLVKNDDVMDLIVVFCILFVFLLVLYCFCVATEFSVNKDLYIITPAPSLSLLAGVTTVFCTTIDKNTVAT